MTKEYITVVAEQLSNNSTEVIPLIYDIELNFINVTLLELPADSKLNINIIINTTVAAVTQFVNLSEFSIIVRYCYYTY